MRRGKTETRTRGEVRDAHTSEQALGEIHEGKQIADEWTVLVPKNKARNSYFHANWLGKSLNTRFQMPDARSTDGLCRRRKKQAFP